ncbi:uncharacterized protein BDZ99DRAFT_459258 [Mytilinidion resinicola]|uniref:Uncharacterized protein n=1 Tax=Mytilinidion resinicola TaxID=574789 RepID=A0A6A6Z3P6_9PEZI|nr:uncharacterized protein BDZ99DRAFT_459258 [Mytilinidion resinicola]KAF2815369.1 hypothetical protein BDZ99DRAFT_459258 [Mytilinidion resinicola]
MQRQFSAEVKEYIKAHLTDTPSPTNRAYMQDILEKGSYWRGGARGLSKKAIISTVSKVLPNFASTSRYNKLIAKLTARETRAGEI